MKFFENFNLFKKFCVKPLFNRDGSGISNEIILLENGKIIRDDNEFAKKLHSYFSDDKIFRHDRK